MAVVVTVVESTAATSAVSRLSLTAARRESTAATSAVSRLSLIAARRQNTAATSAVSWLSLTAESNARKQPVRAIRV